MTKGQLERVTVSVVTEEFRSGTLPAICVHTGTGADEMLEAKATSRIGAQWFLLLLGVLPFVLVRALTAKRAIGYLPVNRNAIAAEFASIRATRKARRATWVPRLGAGAVLAFVASTAWLALFSSMRSPYAWGLLAAGLVLVAGAAFLTEKPLRELPKVWLDRSGERLIVSQASPEFAGAAKPAKSPRPGSANAST